jgi:hypothetical protein
MADLSKCGSLGVRELQPPLQLRLQDAVFGGQVFDPRQQLLVHRSGDVSQDARPIHSSSTPPTCDLMTAKTVANTTRPRQAGNQ